MFAGWEVGARPRGALLNAHTDSLSLTHTLYLSPSNTHTPSLPPPLSHTLSHTQTLSLSHHTHTHTVCSQVGKSAHAQAARLSTEGLEHQTALDEIRVLKAKVTFRCRLAQCVG